jgi:hypothetical protein
MTIDDPDIAELLGEPSTATLDGPPRRLAGRPLGAKNKPKVPHPALPRPRDTRADVLERLVSNRRDDDAVTMDMTDVFAGVSVGWLSKVFGMDPSDVRKRLADCPPLYKRKAGYVYSLPIAAKFLVKPVFDVKKYLESMKPSELPAQLQKDYWDSALKRQKWEENAGHLWRTEAVLETLGETFKLIKFSMQLWADNLERVTGLTTEQKRLLVQMVDGLQDEIYQTLVTNSQNRSTLPVRAELADAEPENDYDDLI